MTDMLSPDDYAQLCELVQQASEAPPADRAALLQNACQENPALLPHAERLLASHEGLDDLGFLNKTGPVKLRVAPSPAADPMIGQQLGPFLIQQHVASGGMGSVYRAVRVDDYRQTVAIKIIKPGLNMEDVKRRFRAERQLQAELNHPHIVTLLDGGATADGRPYFVMEYIDGQPLTQYADNHNLDVSARLRLFRGVASAVQYAHEKHVLHRDLKPSNILVTSAGQVKLVDFGIAKVIDGSEFGPSAVTSTAGRALTPEYASPEQFRGLPLNSATDVYSLGVVLYELLIGQRPFHLHGLSHADMERVICEQEPLPPSVAIEREIRQASGDELTTTGISQRRGSTASALRQQLQGDLDTIVLMALRKEPERRYATVASLSEELQRCLDGRPIQARSASWRYRAQKFVARNPWPLAIAALVLLSTIAGLAMTSTLVISCALAVGLSGAIFGLRLARLAQAQAERRFGELREMATTILFDIDEGLRDTVGTTSLRRYVIEKVLENLQRLAADTAGRPEVAAELAYGYLRAATVLGQPGVASCGQPERAVAAAEESARIMRGLLTKNPDDNGHFCSLVAAEELICDIRFLAGEGVGSLARLEEIERQLSERRQRFPEHLGLQASSVTALLMLGRIYNQLMRPDDAAIVVEQALSMAEQIYAEDPKSREANRFYFSARSSLAFTRMMQSRLDEALVHAEEAQRIASAMSEGSSALADRQYLTDINMLLSEIHRHRCQAEAASDNMRQAIEEQSRSGDVDPDNVNARLKSGIMLFQMARSERAKGDCSAARDRYREAISHLRPLAGSESKEVVATFAFIYLELGDLEFNTGEIANAESSYGQYLDYAQRFERLDNSSPGASRGLMNAWLRVAQVSGALKAPEETQLLRWERALQLAETVDRSDPARSLVTLVDLAKLWAEHALAMRDLGRAADSQRGFEQARKLCRELAPTNVMHAVHILTKLTPYCVEGAMSATEDRELRLYEARAYCQEALAIVSQLPTGPARFPGEEQLRQQLPNAWRTQIAAIEDALVEIAG